MSNSQQLKKGLSVRDLITTGILAALYMVCAMIGEAIFGFFPVLTFLCPLSIALLCGPVYNGKQQEDYPLSPDNLHRLRDFFLRSERRPNFEENGK